MNGAVHGDATHELAEDAAGLGRQRTGRGETQVGQAGAADEEGDKTNQAQARLQRGALRLRTRQQDARAQSEYQQREGVGEIAEEIEGQVGDPGAQAAAKVVHPVGRSGVRPARVLRAVAEQTGEEVHDHGQQQQERDFPQAPLQDIVANGLSLAFRCARHAETIPQLFIVIK